jgi:hypothetical protein
VSEDLRLRMKIWTDPKTSLRYLTAMGMMRDVENGRPTSNVMIIYVMRDDDTRMIELTSEEWNALPFYFFKEDGPAPRAIARVPDEIVTKPCARHDFAPAMFPLTIRIYSGKTQDLLWSREVTLDEAKGLAKVEIPGYAGTEHYPVRTEIAYADGTTEVGGMKPDTPSLPSTPSVIDQRRLDDGDRAIAESSVPGQSAAELRRQIAAVSDAIAAMQSLDDLGPEANAKAFCGQKTLWDRLRMLEQRLKILGAQ